MDAAAAGKLKPLYDWYRHLEMIGLKFGYYVNCSKSWLIVKSNKIAAEAKNIFGESVNITVDGKRHLGAVIGTKNNEKEYCEEIVNNWVKELKNLCEIAETQPQAAYAAYTKGYKSKFTYFIRTIKNFEQYVAPIYDLLNEHFIPTLFGSDTPLETPYRDIISLTPNDGGLGINRISVDSKQQYEASVNVTKLHVESILEQSMIMKEKTSDGKTETELKYETRSRISEMKKKKVHSVIETTPDDIKPFLIQARDKGASSWLNALPIQEQNLDLNKEEFKDALRLRYNLPLQNLPSTCTCGERFNVIHALSCKKGGFVSKRHDNIKDFLTILLNKVCVDVQSEPQLIPVTKEHMKLKTANTNDESRLDIKARGFWRRGQTAFFDIRVTHVNSRTNKDLETNIVFRTHEQAKKTRVLGTSASS